MLTQVDPSWPQLTDVDQVDPKLPKITQIDQSWPKCWLMLTRNDPSRPKLTHDQQQQQVLLGKTGSAMCIGGQ